MSGSAAKGSITSAIRPTSGPKNPGGITPTIENSDVLAPMTSASVKSATAVNPGVRARDRAARQTSFQRSTSQVAITASPARSRWASGLPNLVLAF